ncbi:MAG: DMT family transporter [Eubacteriales bacterium]|nr:DMT family transporter [Eubacteriales bacterium]
MNTKITKLIVIFGVVSMSTSSIFGKMVSAPAMVSAMYRMMFTALLLLPVVIWKHRAELCRADRKSLLSCVLSGVFLGIHFTAYLESLKYTRIASSTVLVDTEVLFVALVLLFFFREKIPKAGLLGIAVTMAGGIVIALGDTSGGTHIIYGDMMAILGALCSSVYTLIGRNQRKYLSTTVYTFLVYASAAVTLFLASVVTGQAMTGYPLSDFAYIAAMVIFCTLLGHSIFSWGLKYISAAFISLVKLGEPVCATIMGIFLFSEIPQGNQIIGGLIVIGGIAMYLFAKENNHVHQG